MFCHCPITYRWLVISYFFDTIILGTARVPILRSKRCTANRSKDGNCHLGSEALIGYPVLWRDAAQHKANLLPPGRISEIWPPKTRGERPRPMEPLLSSWESKPWFLDDLRAFQVFVFYTIITWNYALTFFLLSVTTSVTWASLKLKQFCRSRAYALHWISGDHMFFF